MNCISISYGLASPMCTARNDGVTMATNHLFEYCRVPQVAWHVGHPRPHIGAQPCVQALLGWFPLMGLH